jgi:DNA-binding NtrC family response regulator
MDGMDILKRITSLSSQAGVLVMTAYGSLDSAIEAFRSGAHDYILKPFTLDEIEQRVKNIASNRNLQRQNALLRQEIQQRHNPLDLIYESQSMKDTYNLVCKIAPLKSNVLITGESGTGKELVARAIHELSGRQDGVLVPLNVSAIPDTLVESYLFGHCKGAFTGAERSRPGVFRAAEKGVLFLDEIGELPLHVQPKLLRALEEKEITPIGCDLPTKVDTRIVAATHRDLDAMAQAGSFRQDLLLRLNVVRIHIAPLRERIEDIPPLVTHLIKHHCANFGRPPLRIEPEVMDHLMACTWELGNVRELSNFLERLVIMSDRGTICEDDLPKYFRTQGGECPLHLKEAVSRAERSHIVSILRSVNGSRERAACVLGISLATLYRHLDRLGLKEGWTDK